MYVSLLYFTKILDTLPHEANWSEEHCEATTLCLRKKRAVELFAITLSTVNRF